MPGPVLRAQVVLSERARQASGPEWWWCRWAERVLGGPSGAWSGLVTRYREKKGRRGLTWAQKTGRTWVGRDVYGGGGRWLVLQTCEEADQGQGQGPTNQIEKFAVQPQRTPKGFSFSAGWLKDKFIL